mgnify:CR=1 FL=1
MKESLQNAVSMFNAPLSQAARVLGALQAKAEADPSVLAAGAPAPVAAEEAAPAAAEAEEATEAPAEAVTADVEAEATEG